MGGEVFPERLPLPEQMRPAPVFGRGGIFRHLETFGQVAGGRLHPYLRHLNPRPPPDGKRGDRRGGGVVDKQLSGNAD